MASGPRRTATAGPVVAIMARRLMLRPDASRPRGAGRWRLIAASLALSLGGLVGLWAGAHHLALVAGVGIGGMGLLVGLCLRWFQPAMAVSVMGVALSCASLMTALSVTAGFELEITRALARLNGHVLLTKYGLDFFEYESLAERWRGHPEVTAASPFAYAMVAVVRESDPTSATADAPPPAGPVVVVGKGVDPRRSVELDGFERVFGRGDPVAALRPGDTRHRPGIALGHNLAARLGAARGDAVRVVVPAEITPQGQPVGAPRHATFELMDVLATGTSEVDRNLALMHLSAAQALFFREGRVTGVELELRDPERADDVAEAMTAALPSVYRVSTWKESNSPLIIGLRQIRLTISLVLGLMVVVAASSLIASLLLLVRRKRHDIAVIMALGGTRSLVFWVFEGVGLYAGVVGAALGLSLGGLFCLVIDTFRYPLGSDVYPVDHLPVMVRSVDALGPAVAAIALCGLASGPVAMMAARVRMLDALRR